MRKIFAVLMLCSFNQFALSQIKLSGVVLDSATQKPLNNAFMKLGAYKVIADANGNFSIPQLTAGSHTLTITHIGCDPLAMPLFLVNDTFITIFLPHHLHAFEEIITYAHNSREPDARLIQTISSKKLEQLAAVSLSDALINTNGVSFLRTGSTIAKPIINGMHSNRISVLNDESKQEGQQWGSEHAPEIDPLSAGSIEIIKGASTLRYGGDAMGGVIRILPPSFRDTSYTEIALLAKGETNPKGGLVGLKLERYNGKSRLGQRAVFNVKRNGDAQAASYTLSNTGFEQLSGSYYGLLKKGNNDFSFTSSAFVQRLGILAASHIGNLTDLNRALSSDTPLINLPFSYNILAPSQRIQHYTGKIKWENKSEKLGLVSSTYTIQNNHRQEFDNHNGDLNAALDLNLWTQQLHLSVDNHLEDIRWQYGAMGEWQQNTFKGRYFIPNYLRYKAGLFAIATLERDAYLVEAGLRYDVQHTTSYHYEKDILSTNQFEFSGLSANVSGWRRIHQDVRIHLSAATRFRSPDINELFSNGLHHGSASLEFGDLQLKQERAYSLNAALNYNHNNLRFQVEPYLHYFNNYIYLKPTGETQLSIRGAFPVFNYVQTDASYAGTDITIKYQLATHWTTELDGALLLVKDQRNQTFIYGIPAQRTTGKLKYTFDGLSLKNAYWTVSSSYTAKQNRMETNEDFTDSPAAYTLLNTELGGQYQDTRLHVSIGINNILNTSYRDYMNRYRYYADDVGISIFLILNYTF